jgi:hypothetical protein
MLKPSRREFLAYTSEVTSSMLFKKWIVTFLPLVCLAITEIIIKYLNN